MRWDCDHSARAKADYDAGGTQARKADTRARRSAQAFRNESREDRYGEDRYRQQGRLYVDA